MGLWSSLVKLVRPAAHRFSESAPRPIDQLFAELYGRGGPVTRASALSVPAVQRGRNLICSLATLPLVQYKPDQTIERSSLLEQIDPDVPNVVTLAQTIEDLLFDSISWWRVLAYDWDGFPVQARHLDVHTVSVNPPTGRGAAPLPAGIDPREGVVYVDGLPVGAREIIRFDSPNPPLLTASARAIRRAILLDKAAAMYADDPRPLDYFEPHPDAIEDMEDDAVQEFLALWKGYRKRRSTGYVKRGLVYKTVDTPSPADLQLAELQKQATLEIANGIGVDPEDLGVSTTSRTYANAIDRRQDRINDVYAPFMRAITDRLGMGDVTRRGHRVAFDLGDFMKSNPTERWSTHKAAHDMKIRTREEIRMSEGWGPLPAELRDAPEPAEPADVEDQADEPAGADANRAPAYTFDADRVAFTSDVSTIAFSVDRETRIVEGLALPWGKYASSGGLKLRFERGSVEWSKDAVGRVKLLEDHGAARGVATFITDSSAGLKVRMRVARGAEGDRLLELAQDGVYDGMSVGVDFMMSTDTVPDPRDKTAVLVRRATLREVSLTPMPAFDDARVTKVAASLTGGNTTVEPCSQCGQLHAAGVACPQTPAPPATAAPTAQLAAPAPIQLDAGTLAALAQLLAHNTAATPPAPVAAQGPTPVNPAVRPVTTTQLTEPPSYVFDRQGNLQPGAHDFGMDLVAAAKSKNPDAPEYRRVMEFARVQLDVASADVNELNPNINLPRYIDEREFQYPMWNAVNKGAPPNGIQGFTWPKFSSASGLVGNHTEGTEPTSGTYVTTAQTVTPTPTSGKAKIRREVWDMGGTPGIGNILWQRIVRDWYEALEAAVAAQLDAETPTALATFTTGGGTTGQTLVAEMKLGLAGLHFVRGGFRFDTAFAQRDLYEDLVAARDTQGRPLLAPIGPTNADGTVSDRYQSVNINGVPFIPSWALGPAGAVAESSYLIDRTAVDAWATPPMRIDITETEVANVYVGVWGYKATAVNDINGVREISYDPVV